MEIILGIIAAVFAFLAYTKHKQLKANVKNIDNFRTTISILRDRGDKYRDALDEILELTEGKKPIALAAKLVNIASEARRKN